MHPLARLRLAVAPGLAATSAAPAPRPITPAGEPGEILYGIFLVAAAVVFVVAAGLIGLSILRYRERDEDGEPAARASLRLELLWWAIPTALVIVLFLLAAQVLGGVDVRSPDPGPTTAVSQPRSPR